MFHANTARLIEDWSELRGKRLAPARADISPGGFRSILPQLFILGRDGPDAFRLVGGLLTDLHDCDLRGVPFRSLWPLGDRQAVGAALEQARTTGVPAVLDARAWTAEGFDARLEIVLAPLTGMTGEIDRLLGLYQPTAGVRRLWGRPVVELTLQDVTRAEAARSRPELRLVSLHGERLS